jgi:Fur family ferric uptake transcriptional regulator
MKKTAQRQHFGKILKKQGFKATPGRLEILSIMAKYRVPLSAEDISAKMKAPKINRATVYRTLSSLAIAGIIKQVHIHKGSEHFELNDTHHHHIVCTGCGTIEDFDDCRVDKTVRDLLTHSSFRRINSHSLELFGICKKCPATIKTVQR